MAVLKRGFCVKCQGDERLRIFNVNKTAEVCYCPHCTNPMPPKDAIENYRELISHHLKSASKYLFETTEYLLAYQTFAHIIDLDDSVKAAYYGRLLALVHLSTLRTSKINFAFQMHRQEMRIFHSADICVEYYHFLVLLLDALDNYENKMKKRLTVRGVFYDTDCVALYLQRLDEIRSYKDFILSEAEYFIDIKSNNNDDSFQEIVKRIEEDHKEYEKIFKEEFFTANGFAYKFVAFGQNNVPSIAIDSTKQRQKFRFIKPTSLNPKDNKKSKIKDQIYLNNLALSRLVAASIPVAIILLVLAIGDIFGAIFIPNNAVKIIFYVMAAVVVSISLLLFILHFLWKNRLRRTYYNGTNPFIFK